MKVIILSLLISLSFTACRWGNRSERIDPIELTFLRAETKEVALCAKLDNEDDARCLEPGLDQVPLILSRAIANPVVLWHHKEKNEFALFDPKSAGRVTFVPTRVIPETGEISFSGSGNGLLWEEVEIGSAISCVDTRQLSESGRINRDVAETINGIPVSGGLDLSLSYLYIYQPRTEAGCTKILTRISECLQKVSACPETCNTSSGCPGTAIENQMLWQQTWSEVFSPFIRNKVFSVEELPRLQGMGIEVRYE